VTNLRDIRNKKGIKPREEIAFYAINSPNVKLLFQKEGAKDLLYKLGVINDIQITDTEFDNTVGFVLGTDKFGVILNKVIDAQAEIIEKKQELEYQEGFVKSVESKLNNEKFVSGAPQQVVEKEKQKLADGKARIRILKEELQKLGRIYEVR
jgi:valyl-tRNA synthetase